MQLRLLLASQQPHALLPFNYQYPLSSAIYKIIQSADEEFASFLHNKGYGDGYKRFKLFTFSDIKTKFTKSGDRMLLQSNSAELIVCFYIPQAAENFIKGLFLNQSLQIADQRSKTTFQIITIETLPFKLGKVLQPISPVVVGKKNVRGNYDYLSPQDKDFEDWILHNWLEKASAAGIADDATLQASRQNLSVKVCLFSNPPQSRLITIKGGTDAETKIRGFVNFRLEVTATDEMIELALGAGLGLYNSQGMGCVEIVN